MSDHVLKFSFGGILCIDSMGIEPEVGPENHRAFYSMDRHGRAYVGRIEVNDARHGKPDYWIPCPMPHYVVREIERTLEEEFRQEQRRLVDYYDEQRAI